MDGWHKVHAPHAQLTENMQNYREQQQQKKKKLNTSISIM